MRRLRGLQETRDATQEESGVLGLPSFKPKQNFPGDSVVKTPPAMQEMWVLSLGQEDPLEEGTATHSSILAWRIPWTEEPGSQ